MLRGLALVAAAGLVVPMLVGCACGDDRAMAAETTYEVKTVAQEQPRPLPPTDADAGECFALVYIPPETKTVTERVMVKEASERIEVVPARYEWVEERVCVKDASTRLETVPAEYTTEEKRLVLHPGRKQWVRTDDAECKPEDGPIAGRATDIFCLVDIPPVVETVRQEKLVKPATVREVHEPAEYETVRRHKLVEPAATRRIEIPAEFDTVERTVAVGTGRMEWQRVVCEDEINPEAVNNIKRELSIRGYDAGVMNGQLDKNAWAAIKQYQEDKRLGTGVLSYSTLSSLGVQLN